LGELGRSRPIELALLLQSRQTGRLSIASLQASGDGETLDLTISEDIDAAVPANAVACPTCNRPLRVWGRFCTKCGSDLIGLTAAEVGLTDVEMLDHIQSHASGYQVLGGVPRRTGGGQVYFARDRQNGALVALRLEKQPGTMATDGRHRVEVTGRLNPVTSTPSSRSTTELKMPTDPLAAVRREAAAEFEVFGEIGTVGSSQFYLARERASSDLVALRLVPATVGYALNVHRRLEKSVAGSTAICAGCGSAIASTANRCTQCGRIMSRGSRTPQERERERERLRTLTDATAGAYEFLGEMESSAANSVVYFAKRTSDGAIVAVRCEQSSSFGDEPTLPIAMRETDVLRAVRDDEIAEPATQMPGLRETPRYVSTQSPQRESSPQLPPRLSEDFVEAFDEAPSRRLLVPGLLAGVVALVLGVAVFRSCT
jgi:hypothetical protein